MAIIADDKEIARVFTGILRREVKVSVVKQGPETNLLIAGHYVNGSKQLVGGCFSDRALATHAGAAFSLIPADAARDLLKEKEIDENTKENFAEVLNICTRMFDGGSDLRITLSATEFPPAARSATSEAMLKKPLKRVDLDVEIAGYGKGRLVLATIPVV